MVSAESDPHEGAQPWQAQLVAGPDDDPRVRPPRLRIEDNGSYKNLTLAYYRGAYYLDDTIYSPEDVDCLDQLYILREVVQHGLAELRTVFSSVHKEYETFHSKLDNAIEGIPPGGSGPVIERIPKLKTALDNLGSEMRAMRQAELLMHVDHVAAVHNWIEEEQPSLWVRQSSADLEKDEYAEAKGSLLRVTGVVVAEDEPDKNHPALPQVYWEGSSRDGVSNRFYPDANNRLYVLAITDGRPAGPPITQAEVKHDYL